MKDFALKASILAESLQENLSTITHTVVYMAPSPSPASIVVAEGENQNARILPCFSGVREKPQLFQALHPTKVKQTVRELVLGILYMLANVFF